MNWRRNSAQTKGTNRNVKKQKKNVLKTNKTKKQGEKSTITFVKKGETRHLKLYYVEWKDHATHKTNNWYPLEESHSLYLRCYSVGWQVAETPEAITIAQNVGQNATISDTITILKSCIIKKKQL